MIPQIPKDYEGKVPEDLKRMILKLLEKDKKLRYQSAKGLLSDLVKYKDGQRGFSLGSEDKVAKLTYSTIMIGNERELETLNSAFERAKAGSGSIVLIGGEPGMGKTRLVDEFKYGLFLKFCPVLTGKCFHGENKVPFGVMSEVFSSYLRMFRSYSQEKKDAIRQEVIKEVGELRKIISDINPFMSELVGEAPELVELPQEREFKRVISTISNFLLSIADAEDGLVIILDDLQWVDSESISLLNEIAFEIGRHKLLIVGTYRSNEVIGDHPFLKFIYEQKKNNTPLVSITLNPLDASNTGKFVSKILLSDENKIKEVSDFVFRRTNGNPLFIVELIKHLVNENILCQVGESWVLEEERLARSDIPESIVNAILKNVELLSKEELEVLYHASVIGKRFDIDLLFDLLNISEEEVVRVIDKAINVGLLELDPRNRGKVLFVHDKIRESFYFGLGRDKRMQLHLKVAKVIENLYKSEVGKKGFVSNEIIFNLAYHYIESGEEDKILEYSLLAGWKSKENYGYVEALKYFLVIKNILDKRGEQGGQLWTEVTKSVSDICLVIGRYDKSIELSQELLQYVKDEFELSKIYKQISEAYFKKGDWENCEKFGKIGLGLLGEKLPTKRFEVILGIIKEVFVKLMHLMFPGIFIKNEEVPNSERYKIILWFYYSLAWMYVLSDLPKFMRSVLRIVNLAESKIGKSREFAMAIMGYASFLMAIPMFKASEKLFKISLDIREEVKDEWGVAQSLQLLGYCNQWMGKYRESIKYCYQSLEIFKRIGDVRETGMTYNELGYNYLFLSDYNSAREVINKYLNISIKSNDNFGIADSYNLLGRFCSEEGDFVNAMDYISKGLEISGKSKIWVINCNSNSFMGLLLMESGKVEEALKYLLEAESMYKRNKFVKQHVLFFYPALAEAYILAYIEKGRTDKSLLKNAKRVCKISLKETKSWPTFYGESLRVYAKYLALLGKNREAERYFNMAISHSQKLEKRYELGKCFYDYGVFLNSIGRSSEGRRLLESAYVIFKEIGSKHYLEKVSNLLGIKEVELGSEDTKIRKLQERQRLSSIIKISQDISSILDIDVLLESIISKSIEITGARRGGIFLWNDSTKELELRISKGISEDVTLEVSRNIIRDVYQTSKPIITVDAQEEEVYGDFQSVQAYNLKSVLCVPIRFHEKTLGVCYLDNPLSRGVFKEEDTDLLSVFMSQAGIAIENARIYKELADLNVSLEKKVQERTEELVRKSLELEKERNELRFKNEIIEKELEMARKIQMRLIPALPPKENMSFIYKPMEKVGGDFFDFVQFPGKDWVGIFISDVSGHGVPAAFITAMIKTSILRVASSVESPVSLLEYLNEILLGHSADNFVTVFYGIYKPETNEIYYSSAGHLSPYLLYDGKIEKLRIKKTLPLAVVSNGELKRMNKYFKNDVLTLKDKSRVVFYTDGLTESVSLSNKFFGNFESSKMLERSLKEHMNEPIDLFVKNVYSDLVKFGGNEHFEDDICIISMDT